MVVLNGLQVAGHFHALIEGVLFGLQGLVMEAILKSSKKKLVLDELEGIRDAFSFGLSEAHFELKDLTVHGPIANSGSVIDTDYEQASRNGVLSWLAVEERDVFRSFGAILCGLGLGWGGGGKGGCQRRRG
jgi:hypothetical protein